MWLCWIIHVCTSVSLIVLLQCSYFHARCNWHMATFSCTVHSCIIVPFGFCYLLLPEFALASDSVSTHKSTVRLGMPYGTCHVHMQAVYVATGVAHGCCRTAVLLVLLTA